MSSAAWVLWASLPGLQPLAPGGDDASCVGCHVRIAHQWQSSGHATAYSNPWFQAAWAERPQVWCLNCHLPHVEDQRKIGVQTGSDPGATLSPLPPLLDAGGVGCTACHLRDGVVLSPNTPGRLAQKAHPVVQSDALVDGTLCAGCHEFRFQVHTPEIPLAYSETPLQQTVSEWQSSSFARTPCADCHLPRGRHTFPGGHDARLLRNVLDVDVTVACIDGGWLSEVRVTADHVGHSVPTGDPFRRLDITLWSDEVQVGTAWLGQSFAPTATSWVQVEDTRVPPPTGSMNEAVRVLRIPVASPPTRWALRYRLADPRTTDTQRQRALSQDALWMPIDDGALRASLTLVDDAASCGR